MHILLKLWLLMISVHSAEEELSTAHPAKDDLLIVRTLSGEVVASISKELLTYENLQKTVEANLSKWGKIDFLHDGEQITTKNVDKVQFKTDLIVLVRPRKLILTASKDASTKIWDANSGECLKTLKGHKNYVMSVSYTHLTLPTTPYV